MTLKQIAIEACYRLAGELIECECQNTWHRADKIERRWSIQGSTDHFVSDWRKRHADYVEEQRKLIKFRNPNPYTFR